MAELLTLNGAVTDALDAHGQTPLELAVALENTAVADLLMTKLDAELII